MNAITKPKPVNSRCVEWTTEMKAELALLYGETPMTAKLIGEALGVSKNSVIGMARRMGLARSERSPIPNPEKSQQTHAKTKAKKKAKKDLLKSCRSIPLGDEPTPTGETGGCQFLHGEPADRNFCGHAVKPGTVWCEHHHARVYIAGTAPNMRRKKAGEEGQ